ncbi:MAG: class I SAM-dependent methyltransferase [Deltaproteobacteria bacterium]
MRAGSRGFGASATLLPMRFDGLPDYANLDLTGEAAAAAARMEARGQEPASAAMFDALVRPLLAQARLVLEVGCGTAALARRIAAARPEATVFAADKSSGMVAVARALSQAEAPRHRLELAVWDVTCEERFPFGPRPFDLIVSSVLVPYLTPEEAASLVRRLAARLAPGGVLAFVEQDLQTDSVRHPDFRLASRVLGKEARPVPPHAALGLFPLLRAAGLSPLPRRSFLWTDERYGPYCRELLERTADDGVKSGRLTPDERDQWKRSLAELARAGEFHYGLVYHLIAGSAG